MHSSALDSRRRRLSALGDKEYSVDKIDRFTSSPAAEGFGEEVISGWYLKLVIITAVVITIAGKTAGRREAVDDDGTIQRAVILAK